MYDPFPVLRRSVTRIGYSKNALYNIKPIVPTMTAPITAFTSTDNAPTAFPPHDAKPEPKFSNAII